MRLLCTTTKKFAFGCKYVGNPFHNAMVLCRKSSNSVAEPVMPPCDFSPTKYQGVSKVAASEIRKMYLSPSLLLYYTDPLMIVQGHMQWLFDDKGKRYLDMFGGIVTVSVGHCHPKVTKAAVDQLNQLWHTTNIYMHPKIHEYAEKLSQRMPGNLKVCFFTNSGAEANDMAVMMSRLYTGNYDLISLRNCYHGMSPTTMALTGLSSWKHHVPNNFCISHAMCPDPYRGLWGGKYCRDSPVQTDRPCNCSEDHCEAADHYAGQLDELLNTSVSKKGIAGFFAESIQGVGGTVQFPKGYIQKAYDLVKSRGGLYIADEVQTGFGRLGDSYWGFQSHGVMPDIVTIAKGMGNGIPIGAVITTPEIAKTITDALFFNTFGGNPVSCAIGSAVLDVLDEDNLQENCRHVGTYFLRKLAALRDEFEIVGDVRGKGLMVGVEFVSDKKTKTPLPKEDFGIIQDNCRQMGVLFGNSGGIPRALRIKPPMCITRADTDFAVDVLRKAIKNYMATKQ